LGWYDTVAPLPSPLMSQSKGFRGFRYRWWDVSHREAVPRLEDNMIPQTPKITRATARTNHCAAPSFRDEEEKKIILGVSSFYHEGLRSGRAVPINGSPAPWRHHVSHAG